MAARSSCQNGSTISASISAIRVMQEWSNGMQNLLEYLADAVPGERRKKNETIVCTLLVNGGPCSEGGIEN